jgi:predicted O-methyltransferase YrrM
VLDDGGLEVGAKYTIDGGLAGKQRLDVLARVCEPGTALLFDQVGVAEGAACLDVGCGGGHVSRELARRAGASGKVLGIDLDETVLELARVDVLAAELTNVEFRCGDAMQLEPATYDLAYARCLLSHVDDPAGVVAAMAAAVRPGGAVVVEDIDFTGYFCHPPSRAHELYLDWYRETVGRRGGDADLGLTLPALLGGVGLEDVSVSVSQACAVRGETKLIPPLTLERIADAVLGEGVASAEELGATVRELYELAEDSTTIMGMPRLVQAWGSVPGAVAAN